MAVVKVDGVVFQKEQLVNVTALANSHADTLAANGSMRPCD
jgi:hypothetical protein